jgi:hypothetical protein
VLADRKPVARLRAEVGRRLRGLRR